MPPLLSATCIYIKYGVHSPGSHWVRAHSQVTIRKSQCSLTRWSHCNTTDELTSMKSKEVQKETRWRTPVVSFPTAGACLPFWRGRNTVAFNGQKTYNPKQDWDTVTGGALSTGTKFLEKAKNNLWVEKSFEAPWRHALDRKRHFRKCSVESFSAPTHPSH